MIILLHILLALAAQLSGQRHLPQTQIFQTPGLMLLDTRSESPAVYHGSGNANPLKKGESIEIQVFAPRAARQNVYAYSLRVERDPSISIPLTITSAKDWQGNELMSGKPNSTLSFSSTRPSFSLLPRTGHVMTLTFTATEDTGRLDPMLVTLSLTVVSTPPRRVNEIVGRQSLTWG